MSKIDKTCTDILRGFKGYEDIEVSTEGTFQKRASHKVSNKYKNIMSSVNLKKLASEIRKVAAPVEVTNADMDAYIKEIRG